MNNNIFLGKQFQQCYFADHCSWSWIGLCSFSPCCECCCKNPGHLQHVCLKGLRLSHRYAMKTDPPSLYALVTRTLDPLNATLTMCISRRFQPAYSLTMCPRSFSKTCSATYLAVWLDKLVWCTSLPVLVCESRIDKHSSLVYVTYMQECFQHSHCFLNVKLEQ